MSATEDVVIVGGGASGLAAACFNPGALVLERGREPGLKLLVTGGGRCNFAHACTPDEAAAAFGPPRHARFTRRAFTAFPPSAQRGWFESLGVPAVEEPGGFLFPESGRAEDVRSALVRAAVKAGSRFECGCAVENAVRGEDGAFYVRCAGREPVRARKLVLACGGCARAGRDVGGAPESIASSLGLETEPALPALGALHVDGAPAECAGLTLPDALLRAPHAKGVESRGALLVTHTGFSGPAALDFCADAAAAGCGALKVSWRADRTSPDEWIGLFRSWRRGRGAALVRNLLADELPRSLAAVLCARCGAADRTASQLGREETLALADSCAAMEFENLRTDGFGNCMAVRGGVSTGALNPRTLEARAVPGLFVIGEACAPVGRCGGYNLSWAWASAFAARIQK